MKKNPVCKYKTLKIIIYNYKWSLIKQQNVRRTDLIKIKIIINLAYNLNRILVY